MYIAKLKDGLKRVTKTFSMICKRFSKWYDGGGKMKSYKKGFKVKVFSSSQNIGMPFYLKRFLKLFSLFFFNTFSSSFSLFFLYALSLEDLEGFDDIREEKSLHQKLLFKWNGMDWLRVNSTVDAYSGMELWMAIWLNHDHGDGRIVDISAVDAHSRVEVCTPIFLIHKSFSKNLQNSNGHIP
jgi:hypothetical protein